MKTKAFDALRQMKTWPNLPRLMAMGLLGVVVAGCGQDSSGPSAEELIRQQRQRKSQELSKPKTLEESIQEIEGLLSDENTVAAEKRLRPLLSSNPSDPDLLALWAKCQAINGDFLEAVETIELIESDDDEARAEQLWNAANWLVEGNHYDRAEELLRRLLELPGDPARVHRMLATILNNQGRRVEAGVHLKALAMLGEVREKELVAMITYSRPFIDKTLAKPDFGSGLHPAMLAEAKSLRDSSDLDRAIDLTRRLRQAFPGRTSIIAFEGRLYGEAQLDDLFRTWLDSLPASIEVESEYWSTLGEWLQRKDRHREAIRCFAEAVRRDPTDRFTYDRLQRSLRFEGETEAADLADKRFQRLAETSELADHFGSQRGTREELLRMSKLLAELQRPWESLAWKKLALTTYDASSQELDALRKEMAAANAQTIDVDPFAICGLDLSKWPKPDNDVLRLIPSADSNVTPRNIDARFDLRDVAAAVGFQFQYDNGDPDAEDLTRYLHQLSGGGIGVIDYDRDGWSDLYMTQGAGDAYQTNGTKPNQLFRNLGGRRFGDATAGARTGHVGYGQGVEVADLNQDGFADMLVANIGVNIIYLNNGDGTFSEQSLPSMQEDGFWTSTIACGDLNGDHLPEIVEVNYADDPKVLAIRCTPEYSSACNPHMFRSAVDRVWQIDPRGDLVPWEGLENRSEKAAFGFAALITNFDQEPGNELFIANDAGSNHFWVGRSDTESNRRVLMESARVFGCAFGHDGVARGCMGVAWGDFNRDTTLDLQVTNYWDEPSDIFLQRPTGLFVPASQTLGVFVPSRKTVGWGTVAIDLNRDGWLDLSVLNGHVREDPKIRQPFDMKPQVFSGGPEGFSLVEETELGDSYWSTAKSGRTMATLDWNGDGKPDLVTNHLNDSAALLENRTTAGHSLRVQLVGTICERDAIGAVVTLHAGDQKWTGWQTGGDGYLCSHESVVDFGLGDVTKIDRLDVTWPNGSTQRFEGVPVDEACLIVEGQDAPFVQTHE